MGKLFTFTWRVYTTSFHLPFIKQPFVVNVPETETFEKIVEKGENVDQKHFLLLLQFSSLPRIK